MKVLTFSKVFPKTHINAGEPTNFKEKILSGEKIHTIRPETTKWKIGDQISMRYWTGKPYHSKQEIFCEKFEVVELLEIAIEITNNTISWIFNVSCEEKRIAKNDGLTWEQLESWFAKKDGVYSFTLIAWQTTNY